LNRGGKNKVDSSKKWKDVKESDGGWEEGLGGWWRRARCQSFALLLGSMKKRVEGTEGGNFFFILT
jgi:hypothetical protein